MSFLPVLKTCHNHPTISESSPQTLHAETLVPFYLHLPKKLSGLFLSTLSPPLSVKHVIHQETPSSPPKFNQQPSTIQFNHTYQPIGFLRPPIVEALVQDNQHMKQIQKQTCWKLFYLENEEGSLPVKVSFEDWINQSEDWLEARSKQLQRLIRGWKENGLFLDQLAGWRNEEYSVYGPKDQTQCSKLAFRIERSAVGLFGVLSFGVHLTAYIKKEGNFFFWVPRRSATKATWPSKLDNTVAGGISSGETAFETISTGMGTA
ncbi:hypothetical protein PCASD_20081 [Puccinia coronata f. sp. avenae]|uniref:DUF4743 domain-containing protein n=1 Tax=Puccinia coronata f. sp. avenae TaxID=200324 RepID=A0A2N5TPY6_9BASI|nr:hypothetical protein PCASD_20081 [Puccinia coronata f. sp. avenae]